jgi:dTDP-4-dehydrorhamnose reductase
MTETSADAVPKPRILVFGGGGQLGRALAERAESVSADASLQVLTRAEADIADAAAVARAFDRIRPSLVINAAAYTAVDRAESEEKLAFEGNALGPYHLASLCARDHIPLFHISTDYVFSGEGSRPWREDDPTAPQNAYGRSKLAGEWAVLATHPDSHIFRTSWVFSPWGHNFVKTMLRLAKDRDELSIVADQKGCPTYAPDLADALLQIAIAKLGGRRFKTGIHHFSNQGATDWAEFATTIFGMSARHGGPRPTVKPIASKDYPTPATRPAWSVLDLTATVDEFGLEIPPWTDALGRCLETLRQQETSA